MLISIILCECIIKLNVVIQTKNHHFEITDLWIENHVYSWSPNNTKNKNKLH